MVIVTKNLDNIIPPQAPDVTTTLSDLTSRHHESLLLSENNQNDTTTSLTLGDLQTRHEQILNLERNIQDVHVLFQDMAVVVEAQSDIIDDITFNFDRIRAQQDEVTSHMIEAKKYAKKSRCNII